ncbi:hypothetical protein ACWC9S_05005 [Streptomyces xiamenensis]
MRRPVTGEVHVHYHQIYVVSDPHDAANPDLAEAFAGQSGGLCGAAAPGALWLRTGLLAQPASQPLPGCQSPA